MNGLFNLNFSRAVPYIASCVRSVLKRSVCACGRVIARGLYIEAACRARSAAGSMSFVRVPGLLPPPPPPPGRRGPERSSPRGSPNEVDVIVRSSLSFKLKYIYIYICNTLHYSHRRDNSEVPLARLPLYPFRKLAVSPYIFFLNLVEIITLHRHINISIL